MKLKTKLDIFIEIENLLNTILKDQF